jgi:hypothetical protein
VLIFTVITLYGGLVNLATTDMAPLSVHIIANLDDDESFPFLKEALTSMVCLPSVASSSLI